MDRGDRGGIVKVDARARSTFIYLLVSVILALVGLVLILLGAKSNDSTSETSQAVVSIGASVLAGGIASIGFVVLRFLDDSDARRLREDARQGLATIVGGVAELRRDIRDYAMSAP